MLLKGFGREENDERPFCWGGGRGVWCVLFRGLDGICGRLKGGGDDGGLRWLEDTGRGWTGDELPFAPLYGEPPYAASDL